MKLAAAGALAAAAVTGFATGSAHAASPAFTSGLGNAVHMNIVGTHSAGTVYEHGGTHDCKGQNECKGQGGCKSGDNGCKGKNSCKGKGGCASGHE